MLSNLKFYEDIYLPASAAPIGNQTDHWSTGYKNQTNFVDEPGPYNRAWRLSMVPELLCLPLEELYVPYLCGLIAKFR